MTDKKPGVSVKEAQSVGHVIGINAIATSAATAKALVTKAQVAGRKAITRIQIYGSKAAWLIPNVKDNDPLGSNASAAQKAVVVTDSTKFTAGDWVLLYENDYTTHEFGKVASIVAATHTLTLESNLTNAYTTTDETQVLAINSNSNDNFFMALPATWAVPVNIENVAFESLWVRRMGADDVTVNGWVGVV